MRKIKYETKTVTRPVVVGEIISCDFCGDDDEYEVFDIAIETSIGTCGHTRTIRDICQSCFETKVQTKLGVLLDELKFSDETLRQEHEDI